MFERIRSCANARRRRRHRRVSPGAAADGFVVVPPRRRRRVAPSRRCSSCPGSPPECGRQRLRQRAEQHVDDAHRRLDVAGRDRRGISRIDETAGLRCNRNAAERAADRRCVCRHEAAEHISRRPPVATDSGQLMLPRTCAPSPAQSRLRPGHRRRARRTCIGTFVGAGAVVVHVVFELVDAVRESPRSHAAPVDARHSRSVRRRPRRMPPALIC